MDAEKDADRRSESACGTRLVGAAEAYLREHSAEKFSLQAVAQALYVNGCYLLRVYRANTGHTLLWYHNYVRCEKAKRLLKESNRNVLDVGKAVGYLSCSHFSHIFRKMTGMTPTAYRKKELL